MSPHAQVAAQPRIEDIDAEIQTLRDKLLALASERNLLASPICRLPADLLARIFLEYKSLVAGITFASNFPQSEVHLPLPWVRPSHVCSKWRSIALDTATMWDVLYLNSAPWTEECLNRSRAADLHVLNRTHRSDARTGRVWSGHDEDTYQKCLLMVFPHFGRVTSFDIRNLPSTTSMEGSPGTPSRALIDAFANADPSSIRQLALSIHGPMYAFSPYEPPEDRRWDFLHTFLHMTVGMIGPLLTSLDINACSDASWTQLQYPSLTRMKIMHSPRSIDTGLVIALLSRTPNLEAFEFQHQRCSLATVYMGPVHLPHLEDLHISSSFSAALQIVQHIIAAPGAQVNLSTSGMGSMVILDPNLPQVFCNALLPYFSSNGHSVSGVAQSCAMAVGFGASDFCLSFTRSASLVAHHGHAKKPFALTEGHSAKNATHEIRIQDSDNAVALPSVILPQVVRHLDCVERLTLTSTRSAFQHDCRSLFSSILEDLRRLVDVKIVEVHLPLPVLRVFFDALRPNLLGVECLFPHVEVLLLCNVAANIMPGTALPNMAAITPQYLTEIFNARRNAGMPISSCEFHFSLGSTSQHLFPSWINEVHTVTDSVKFYSAKGNGEYAEVEVEEVGFR